ncbi:GNAT family N-acetyltransferase [Aquihabitans sp. G128]|uniref:GNAT family N-acetyltransferase n=1 Tax=Aquihabitans sp. G128 TaxID=2849779 RepID=UPI001C23125E|nr:GNAT family N-acetyltransferase [Aquihabitans sp. G128]QXC59262.1 GNAT family N-acetyltransferase [Aquihabitans sp. G128]
MTFRIRPLQPGDRTAWEPLWAAYLDFYATELAEGVTDEAWRRLADALEPVGALGAFAASDLGDGDGALLGFAHHTFHRATWSLTSYCYLEDLYTDPAARGRGVGRALVEATAELAVATGSDKLYWHTDTTNATARSLYDQLATHDGVIVYERTLP